MCKTQKVELRVWSLSFFFFKETILHILWFYHITQDIWCQAIEKVYAFLVANSWKEELIGLGIHVYKRLSMIRFNKIISYQIWKTRCKVLFEEGFLVNVVETVSL